MGLRSIFEKITMRRLDLAWAGLLSAVLAISVLDIISFHLDDKGFPPTWGPYDEVISFAYSSIFKLCIILYIVTLVVNYQLKKARKATPTTLTLSTVLFILTTCLVLFFATLRIVF